MLDNSETIIVTIGSVISFLFFYSCVSYCSKSNRQNQQNRLENTRKMLTVKHRIKPVIEIIDYEQCEIRHTENTGDQNV